MCRCRRWTCTSAGFAQFVRACAGHGAPLATGEDGARSMAVALAGLESARSGRVEAISLSRFEVI